MLQKLPSGQALLGVIDVKHKESLETNIYSLQQRLCVDGLAWNNGKDLAVACYQLVPMAQNEQERLAALCI